MKPALLKTLAIVLLSALGFLGGWILYHGGWESLTENSVGKHTPKPFPSRGALALGPDGYYWGVTMRNGGLHDYHNGGYVYKMKADGSNFQMVFPFFPYEMGPQGGLVFDGVDSMLGVTAEIGQGTGHGTLYKINVLMKYQTPEVEFTGKEGPYKGSGPMAALVSDGKGFYWGSTSLGGIHNTGTIFKYHPATGVFTAVADIPPARAPEILKPGPMDVLASDGKGYWWGTTYTGGKGSDGTVFKVNADTGELTTVVEFTEGKGGVLPKGGLVDDGQGFLWGTCVIGGQEHGTIYKVNATTGELTTVVEFTGEEGSNLGHFPEVALASDGHGFLWGCTGGGGSGVMGTLFKVHIASGVLTTLVEFDRKETHHKGYGPEAPFVSDGHGAFLGTTSQGGKKNAGTIFKIDIATGVLTTLVELGKVGP